MAPVAGGITDTHQYRQVFLTSLLKRFFTPGMPVHRIVGMLQQIRTALEKQAIGIAGPAVGIQVMGTRFVIGPPHFSHFMVSGLQISGHRMSPVEEPVFCATEAKCSCVHFAERVSFLYCTCTVGYLDRVDYLRLSQNRILVQGPFYALRARRTGKAAVRFLPEAPAKPVPCVVNSQVF